VRTVRDFFARLLGKARPASSALPPVKWPETPMPSVKPSEAISARLNPQAPPKRMPVPLSRAVAAASVPRRSPVAAATPTPSATRSSTTDDGMSMLPAAMLLSSRDDTHMPASCSRWDAPVSGGGSFDGGGASGNWDSGSSSSSDSYSSSDSGGSSSSCD